ncbi:acetoacetate decarboxylase family protein [Chloroflexota bacterium]
MRDSPFFKNTPRKTLDMAGQQVEFPILYYDLRCVTSIFTAKTERLKKLLPHSNFKPIEMWPGTGMLGITAFEYYDTSIGPYNEIAVTVPIKFPPCLVIPGLATISMMRNNVFPVYIIHLPVTTDIALKAGIQFWNYPKFLADITFQDQGDNLEVTLKENDRLILKVYAKKLATKGNGKILFHTYSIKDKVVMHALVEGWAQRLGAVMMGNVARLELGEHQIGRELADLGLSKIARSGQYAEKMMTKLYDPDRLWDVETLTSISR